MWSCNAQLQVCPDVTPWFSAKMESTGTCVSLSEGVAVPKVKICATCWLLTLDGYRVYRLSVGLCVFGTGVILRIGSVHPHINGHKLRWIFFGCTMYRFLWGLIWGCNVRQIISLQCSGKCWEVWRIECECVGVWVVGKSGCLYFFHWELKFCLFLWIWSLIKDTILLLFFPSPCVCLSGWLTAV